MVVPKSFPESVFSKKKWFLKAFLNFFSSEKRWFLKVFLNFFSEQKLILESLKKGGSWKLSADGWDQSLAGDEGGEGGTPIQEGQDFICKDFSLLVSVFPFLAHFVFVLYWYQSNMCLYLGTNSVEKVESQFRKDFEICTFSAGFCFNSQRCKQKFE